MKANKHTPGPWKAVALRAYKFDGTKSEEVHYKIIKDNEDSNTVNSICSLNNEDNARLIAAAPELLEACKEAFNFVREQVAEYGRTDDIELANRLETAINKAEGRIQS